MALIPAAVGGCKVDCNKLLAFSVVALIPNPRVATKVKGLNAVIRKSE